MKRKCDGNEVETLEFVDDEIENNNNCDIQKFVCVSDYLLEFTIMTSNEFIKFMMVFGMLTGLSFLDYSF